jgi:hypothetical protein
MAEIWRCLLCRKDVEVGSGTYDEKPYCDKCQSKEHIKFKRNTQNIKIRGKEKEEKW